MSNLSDTPHGNGLTFERAFDYYEQVVYEPVKLANTIAELLEDLKCCRVLDCAAGTGTPGLQLRALLGAEDYTIDCSDGDEDMVAQFRRNAVRLGVNSSCEVRQWDGLDQVADRYDYVMCRGNSLVYGRSWDGSSYVADEECISRYLTKMASVLVPGGYLHIDGPRHYDLKFEQSVNAEPSVTRHTDDSWIAVRETVTDHDDKRLWECTVELQIDSLPRQSLSFHRYSSKLTLTELEPLVKEAGFDHFRTLELAGDRTSGHATLLARKHHE